MKYPEAYAHIYQKMEGFKIKIQASKEKEYTGYLSLNPSTRSTYDIAMRDATIDGLITMDNIVDLKPGQTFYKEVNPNEIFILQSVNQFERQFHTRNINAIKQNSFITVQRFGYNEETYKDEYQDIYKDVISFVSIEHRDEKNFQPGVEDESRVSIQIPKRDIEGNLHIIHNADRLLLSTLEKEVTRRIRVESVDEFGVPGVVKIFGTFDTRTGE